MMRYRKLGATGMDLSIIGMGGSGYGNVYGKYNEEEAIRGVHHALQKGINYFDTAYWYGQGKSEEFLGKALNGIPREKYYIATKVGRYERDIPSMFNFTAEGVTESALASLKRLKLDYVDLLQIHDVEFAPSVDMIVNDTLPALQRLKERGLCRYIGITGYPLGVLREVVEQSHVTIDCVLSYCRLTLNDSSLVDHFQFFQSRGIPLINASAVGMGLLTGNGVLSWHPAGKEIQVACEDAVQYCQSEGVDITRLATKYTTSFEEVTTTLITMVDPALIDKVLKATLEPLTEKEIEVQETILRRFFHPLKVKHWEGVEVSEYWKKMESTGVQNNVANGH